MAQERRRAEINRFKRDPACRLFLSTDSGSVGLNLQAASAVVNVDLPWNPAKLEQRIARAWRNNQTRSVTVVNLVAEGTIEHSILHLLGQKQALADGVIDGQGDLATLKMPSGGGAFIERMQAMMDIPARGALRVISAEEAFVADLVERLGERALLVQERRGEDGRARLLVVLNTDAETLATEAARRQHRQIDNMQEIASLHKRGYSDAEIGQKIGVSASWVSMIVTLLERGEERLVVAVETGLIPISFAIDIARADHAEVQNVLMDAYAAGKIKGKKLVTVRRLLDQRVKRSKTVGDSGLGRKSSHRKITPADLMRLYQREAEKQRLLVKKSDYAQAKLLFIVEALKDLLADEAFTTLLRAERLDTMPRALTARIAGERLQ
ncbi:MAG: plasmid partitioning protein RepB C-terminal domain-containing protein [Methylocystis sp.]